MKYKIFNNEFIRSFTNSEIDTPCYIYDTELLNDTFCEATKQLQQNFKNAHIHYAIKANTHPQIVKLAKKHNIGIDCVSGGEIAHAFENNIESQNIVFAGVGKSDDEINLALDNDIFCFNCESIEEIEVIDSLAKAKDKTTNISIRINPNINAKTHHYISTGQFDDKFGVTFNDAKEFLLNKITSFSNINFIGLHYHVGSQISDFEVFASLAKTVNTHYEELQQHNIRISHLNFGGGLGIDYENPADKPICDFSSYFKSFAENFKYCDDVSIHFELGRSLVAQCGIILTKVLFTKTTHNTSFLIIDAGMTELIRPALYQAQHKIISLSTNNEKQKYHIAGPICESSDIFAKNLELARSHRNDIIVIYSTGAYARVLASNYNLRDFAPEYFI